MAAEGGPLRSVIDSHGFDDKPVVMDVFPDEEGKFAFNFQHAIQAWRLNTQELFRPVEAVFFEPRLEDGSPWLVHPAWEPVSKDNLSTLYTESRTIFRERRWDVIERAVNLREMGYWRQEYGPRMEQIARYDTGIPSVAYSHLRMFRRVTRARLHHMRVRFEVVPLAEIERHAGDEYGQLELEVLVLEDLRKADKLTPRAYYQDRNERFDKLGVIEVAALEGIKS